MTCDKSATWKNRIASGLCPRCGGERDGSAQICGDCQKLHSRKRREKRARDRERRRMVLREPPRRRVLRALLAGGLLTFENLAKNAHMRRVVHGIDETEDLGLILQELSVEGKIQHKEIGDTRIYRIRPSALEIVATELSTAIQRIAVDCYLSGRAASPPN
jgi:DNA-binding transcriptional ArsR family regulator